MPLMSKGLTLSSDVPMHRMHSINSPSEHDLFIRLFLTGGGGW